jgi:hypothetical protein
MNTSGWHRPLRAVEYDAEFDDQIAQLRGDHSPPGRVDEVVAGVEWAVATSTSFDVFASTDVPGGGFVYCIKTDPAGDEVPALRIYFTVDDEEKLVTMRWVEPDPNYDLE